MTAATTVDGLPVFLGYTDEDYGEAVDAAALSARDQAVVTQVVTEVAARHGKEHASSSHPICRHCVIRDQVAADDIAQPMTPDEASAAWKEKAAGRTVPEEAARDMRGLLEAVGWINDDNVRNYAVRYEVDEDLIQATADFLLAGANRRDAERAALETARSRAARWMLFRRKPPPMAAPTVSATLLEAFDAGTLAEIRARPAEPPHRVRDLIPSDASTLIVAQRKTGKTSLLLNLADSLLTGRDFLGRFEVRPIGGSVTLLNYEVGAAQVQRWADDLGIPDDRLFLVNLRGRRNPLANEDDRGRLAALLKSHQTESVIVDPFGRAYSGTSQNDPGEVGAWLADLDRFARGEVGATDLVLAAHAGWQGERARGSSALEDWADSIVTMTKSETDGTRWLRAIGRDVDVDEDALAYDPATRRLSMTGAGSRQRVAAHQKVTGLMPFVVDVVTTAPGVGIAEIVAALRVNQHTPTFQDRDVSKAAREAVEAGQIRVDEGGAGRKKRHFPTTPSNPVQTPSTDAAQLPRPTPVYMDGVVLDAVTPPDPVQLDGVTCSLCSAELWHRKSQERGMCEKCARATAS